MKKIRSIMCCCGSGLGSSMMVEMNIQNILKNMDLHTISVGHTSLSEVTPTMAALFVVGLDIEHQMRQYPRVIVLKDLVSNEELSEKLKEAFSKEEDTYIIK